MLCRIVVQIVPIQSGLRIISLWLTECSSRHAYIYRRQAAITLNRCLQDPQLQKRLQQVLKLNKEKWEEARDHALKAVVVDNRMRVWWAASTPPSSNRVGTGPTLARAHDHDHAHLRVSDA